MLTLIAAEKAQDITQNVWVVVGVPVLVALIGAAAAVGVAWCASRSAVVNADRDRQQAILLAERIEASEKRTERAETYEIIVGEIAALAARYSETIRAAQAMGRATADHPNRAPLVRALARITSRHDGEDVNLALVEWLHHATQGIDLAQGPEMLGMFQSRLAAWYLKKGSDLEVIEMLDKQTAALKDGAALGYVDRDNMK